MLFMFSADSKSCLGGDTMSAFCCMHMLLICDRHVFCSCDAFIAFPKRAVGSFWPSPAEIRQKLCCFRQGQDSAAQVTQWTEVESCPDTHPFWLLQKSKTACACKLPPPGPLRQVGCQHCHCSAECGICKTCKCSLVNAV